MTLHCMVDLETLSTASDALILSIGAAKFDPHGSGVADSFHVAVDLDLLPAKAYGFDISPSTLAWWLSADRADARAALAETPKTDLVSALDGFADWFGPDSLPTWGNGAGFDNVILRNACARLGLTCPWKWWHDRCYRTLKNLAPGIDYLHVGVAHSALDDARSQALHAQKVFTRLRQEVVT